MKKAYNVPAMRVVTLRHRTSLLTGSNTGPLATSVKAPGMRSGGSSTSNFGDFDDGEVEFFGKFFVAFVAGGNRHNSAGAVAH